MTTSLKIHEEALRLADGIQRLAYNIWWTWNPKAQELFKALSEEAWIKSRHNAIAVMRALSHSELVSALYGKRLSQLAKPVIDDFDRYMTDRQTWGLQNCPNFKTNPVAYFSAEFGLHESLPLYSGGLGLLAGDHIKSASDLDVPMVGISLFYRGGYFQQQINGDGWQVEDYPVNDPHNLPVELVTDASGEPLVGKLTIAYNTVSFHAWRLKVGRSTIYLLDTNRPENDVHYREVTSRVYGGDQFTRICQELVLGVGGIRLLRMLGIKPSVHHLNEGHSAFLLLELLREQIAEGKSFEEAQKIVREEAVFTTHTPVPAGHDRFTADLMTHAMGKWPENLKISQDQFMGIGRINPDDHNETFCMTALALKMTRAANGVSELHGAVSRKMWTSLYPGRSENEVPIGHITNGVHILGWMNRVTYSFWEENLGVEWLKHIMEPALWEKVSSREELSDEVIWSLRTRLKRQMIEAVRAKLEIQRMRIGAPISQYAQQLFNPDALTLGFARRFATYKRATLIFSDLDRAAALFNDSRRPLQLIMAGKAHPRDDYGKQFIQKVYQLSHDPRFAGKLIFLENYDIQLARYMVSGCDVWLNNPRRPLEASGTSGQKCCVHGCLNLSILDGWWREGYNGVNGFAIGEDSNSDNVDEQDRVDAENLYRTLEQDVVPEYYDRDAINVPRRWIKRIRQAMVTLIPQFNTDRMVAEYAKKYYLKGE